MDSIVYFADNFKMVFTNTRLLSNEKESSKSLIDNISILIKSKSNKNSVLINDTSFLLSLNKLSFLYLNLLK